MTTRLQYTGYSYGEALQKVPTTTASISTTALLLLRQQTLRRRRGMLCGSFFRLNLNTMSAYSQEILMPIHQ